MIKIFILNMSYVFTPNILLSQLLIFPFAEQRVFFFNYFENFPVGYISIPIGKHTWQLLVEMIKYASVWVNLFICLYYLFEEFALFNQKSIIFIIFFIFIHNDFFTKRLLLIIFIWNIEPWILNFHSSFVDWLHVSIYARSDLLDF